MSRIKRGRPSPAILVAVIALIAALAGSAIAEQATTAKKKGLTSKQKKQVGKIAKKQAKKQVNKKFPVEGSDIADGAVTSSKLGDGAVTSSKLGDGAVDSAKVKDDSLTSADIAELEVFGDSWTRATATNGATEAAARAAAPEIPFAKKGQLDIYAKCFRDTSVPETFGEIYIRTSAAGAVFESRDEDSLIGGNATSDFLNPGTTETDRQISETTVSGTGTAFAGADDEDFHVFAPDGTNLEGQLATVVKQGSLTAGNGVFGAGNVCLFGGFAIG